MAQTAHGFNIPSPTVAATSIDKQHFATCLECRQEIGAATLTRDRERKPFRTEEDVVKEQGKVETRQSERIIETPLTAVIRPKIWEEKTWPVEAVQITPENIRSVANWCGGEVVENMDATDNTMQFEIRLPSFKGILEGHNGYYVFKYRDTGRFDIMKPAAFEGKYNQTGLRGKDI